jgi:NADH-quinone oxidoreductase subunit C
MDDFTQSMLSDLQAQFEAGRYEFRGETSLIVRPDQIVAAASALRDQYHFEMLVEETAVDYWPEQTPRFHIVYRMRSVQHKALVGVRVPLDGSSPTAPSLVSVYANANWFEREIFDMFGVRFENHPDLRRIVMPADWVGHPLRKDFPLGYEEVQYTFNFEEINLRKPYATE